MKKHAIILSVLYFITISFAQAPDTLWTRTYGGVSWDEGWAVQQTSDSGYIVIGLTICFGAGGTDVYLIRTDVDGDTLWTRTYGGTGNDAGRAGQITSDDGCIIAGNTYSFGVEACDVYLVKTDTNGDTIWTKTYGGSGYDVAWAVQQTSDSGYIIGGTTSSFGAGIRDIYLIRTDENGDTMWTRTYGGTDEDWCFSVQQTFDGGYIAAGHTRSFGAGDYDLYIIRTDTNGDTIWTKTYGWTGSSDMGYSVRQVSDGGYVVAGRTTLGVGGVDVWFLRINADGDTVWTKTYGGAGYDVAYAVEQTADGGYVLTGNTNSFGGGYSDVYLVKTAINGDTLWTMAVGLQYDDEGWSVQETADGGYIIAGTANIYSGNTGDVYLIKTAPESGIKERKIEYVKNRHFGATILSGPLLLPEGKNYKVFDVTGKVVIPDKIKPGIYFVEIDGVISHKVIKIK